MDSLFTSIVGDDLTVLVTVIIILSAAILGLAVSGLYILTNKKSGYLQSLAITLIILPVIIAMIILLVQNSIARAFSLAGAFALIRFRSAPGDPKDITFIFFTLALGLGCGIGYIGYSVVFCILLGLIILILHFTKYGNAKQKHIILKISIPENLNYQNLFDDILEKYTINWDINKVKTSDFGAIFVIEYDITSKPGIDQKAFVDELRCRNGNLNISLITNTTPDSFAN